MLGTILGLYFGHSIFIKFANSTEAPSRAPTVCEAKMSDRRSSTPKDFRARHGNMAHTTFYELIKKGQLRAVKIGRKTVVLDEDEAAWLASLQPIKSAA